MLYPRWQPKLRDASQSLWMAAFAAEPTCSRRWHWVPTQCLSDARIFNGLGAEGEARVTKVVNILQREFAMAMVLTGRTNIASIDRSVIWT